MNKLTSRLTAPTAFAMQVVQRYAWIFRAIAILLLVGGQLAHAFYDGREIACQSSHSKSEQQHSETGAEDSPAPHHCCHSHPTDIFAAWDSAGLASPHLRCGLLSVTDDSLPEPPVQEIDYPPQLS